LGARFGKRLRRLFAKPSARDDAESVPATPRPGEQEPVREAWVFN
jgi:hypothetical protein